MIEINIQKDHVHPIVSVPPRISISQLMGILKGKTAIKIFKRYPQLRTKPYLGNYFWYKGYRVDTIGLDEDKIKKYMKYQEKQERLEEQQRLNFGHLSGPSYKSTFFEGGDSLIPKKQ